jgi:type II secretory pathway component PulF
MPTFTCTLAGGGAPATIEAPDRATAVRELLRRGQTPIRVEPVGGEALSSAEVKVPASGAGRLGGGVSRAEMAMLVRELATGLTAGLQLVPALKTIARQTRQERQRAMLAHLIDRVEHGRGLADAAAEWGRPFDELVINMIRAGEASGRLAEVLTQAAMLMDRDVKLRRSVLSATLYPMILAVLIGVAVVVVVTFIVPNVLRNLPAGTALPLPTRIVQGVASFVGSWWWALLLAGVGAAWGWRRLYADPAFRLRFDAWLLRLPLVGRLLRDVAVARFTRTLGMLTGAGIPILTALRITKGTLGNRAMEAVVDRVCEQIAAGKTIAEPMERSGYFPPMLVQIVNMGERSGRLDEMLNQAAGAFEDRTETSLKLFTTALPPLLVVLLACVVGFVVLSILLPLLSAQEAIR